MAAAIAIVTQPLVRPIGSRPPAVDASRLQAHVRHLSVDLHPRSYDQPRNLDLAARYIASAFEAAGASVTLQDVPVRGTSYRNVVARFGPGTGPVMVIGAHYDSHARTPGADDNASGVAGLLELAVLLGRQPQARPIELVAYTLEEPPHFATDRMGSAWHARSLRATGREVRFMLSLEMIGYFSDRPGSQSYPVPGMASLYSDRGDFISLVGRLADFGFMRRLKAAMAGATDLPVHSINAPPSLEGIDFSDHRNYWQQGYPAVMVTDTAFLRTPNYHRAGDTLDKLDYGRMAKVVQAVYAVTQH
jgi:Zn-dependent M28 family amino/carboxypeptidase